MKRFALVPLGVAALAVTLVASVGAASQAAPTNTAEPRISGTAVVGRTLTATTGTWTGDPTFSFQWVRCPASGGAPNGSDCAAIPGATTRSYVVGGGDVDRRIRVRVTASNADGNLTVASNATSTVQRASGVANTTPPQIQGSATVGSTLTATAGEWSGSSLSYAYSWRRCDADGTGCAAITGATQKTYTVQQVDVGNTLRVRVVARNDNGRSGAATSAPTARVTAGGTPGPAGCPTGNGTLPVASVNAPARLLVDRQQLEPSVVTRGTETLRVRFHVSACNGRSVQGALVYVTAVPYNQFSVPAEQATDASGWATLEMRRLRGYPATESQQLLVMFVRARKGGEPLLGGISTRRLVSFPVRLNG